MLLGQIQQCTDPVSPHPRGAIGQVHLNREQVGQAAPLTRDRSGKPSSTLR